MFTVRMRAVWVGALMLLALTMGRAEVAYVTGDTTFLPLTMLNESVDGGAGEYDAAKQTVTLNVFNDRGTFVFQLGADTATQDGKPLKLEAAPFRLDNVTYVPLGPVLSKACGITAAAPKNGFLPITYAIPENVTEFTHVNHTVNVVLQPLTPAELALRRKPIADADARAIFNAVVHNDAATVAKLMKARPELRFARNNFGDLPLHFAVRCRLQEMVKALLANGASLEDRNGCGATPLSTAVFPEVTGYNPNPHDIGPVDQLGVYPEGSSVEGMVNLLLKLGSNVNTPAADGRRPLHMACVMAGERPDIMLALIAFDADVNAEDRFGRTPIFMIPSTAEGELLLAKGADLKHRDSDGQTALHFAACAENGGNPLLVKFFVEHGIPADAKNHNGETPLMHAGPMGNTEMVAALLDNGADVNAADDDQTTALMRMVGNHAHNDNSVEIVKLLLARGARVNAEQDGVHTALHSACYGGNPAIVKLLLAAGAKVNAKDQDDQTPLQIAKRLEQQEVVKLLQAAGAK